LPSFVDHYQEQRTRKYKRDWNLEEDRLPAAIHVGIGGWDYDPWRGTFYPPGLAKAKQLDHAGRHLSAIEINATHYKLQKPELFQRWRDTVPAGFKFAIKASRFCTNRRVLAEAGEAIDRFCGQGITELGDKLGPILWQFMPTKQFDPDDFGAFLALLPESQDGVRLRHALEVRHESFRSAEFVAMAHKANAAIVFADSDTHPQIADLTADFAYARLQRCREDVPTGYDDAALDRWAAIVRGWASGERPAGLAYVTADPPPSQPRETFVFFIAGAKVRAPAAAQSLIARL
jgi:uncharacterized protein YecE (DUF72 family)